MSEKIWWITGASSGIGAATARAAVSAGHKVALSARGEAQLKTLVEELGATHALAVPCDTTDWVSQQQAVAAILERFGRLDVAFANAGFAKGGSFLGGDDTPDEWREMILTNVYGVALTARAALPALVKSTGHLLLTGSVAGRIHPRGNLYAATKWALSGLGESIRLEVTGQGVRVTLLEPGRTATAFWSGRAPTASPHLSAEDVANTVLWVVSQPANVDINEIMLRPVGQEM